jgi:putative acetyltransferase
VTRPLLIRNLEQADARTFLEVHRASVRALAAPNYAPEILGDWAPWPVDADAVNALLRNWEQEHRLIAEDGGIALGVGALALHKGELTACYVRPDAARRGVGAAIVQRLEAIALGVGLAALELDSSIGAAPFYQARGYRVLGHSEHLLSSGRAMPAVRMRKLLVSGA